MNGYSEIKKALEGVTPAAWRYRIDSSSELHWNYFNREPVYQDANEIWEPLYSPTSLAELLSTLESLQRENEALKNLIDGDNCDDPDKIDALFRRAEAAEAEVKRLVESGQSFANQVRNIIYRLNDTEFSSTVYERDQFDANLRRARQALASTGGEHHGN